MKTSFVALGLALSLLTYAGPGHALQNEHALREECNLHSQAAMRDCLVQKAKESEKLLSQAEDAVRGSISKWDEDARYTGLAKAKFASSNKAFIQYRKAQCAFASSLGGGAIGHALEMRRLACMAVLNNLRAEQLRDALAHLPSRTK